MYVLFNQKEKKALHYVQDSATACESHKRFLYLCAVFRSVLLCDVQIKAKQNLFK